MAKDKAQAAQKAKQDITNQASNTNSDSQIQYITTNGRPSGVLSKYYENKKYKKTWQNLCTSSTCKGQKWGTLTYNPKGTAEGELTCSVCSSDYDCVSGAEKMSPPRCYLKDANGNQNSFNNVDITIGDAEQPSTSTTTTSSSAEGSSTGYSPLLSGEQKFQQLIAEVTNGVDILCLCKRNVVTITDFETIYAEAKVLRDKQQYVNEDIHLWQLEDGTYELNVNEYGFFNTVNVVYSGGTVTESYEDLVRVYGIMAKTYYDKTLTKSQAQAKAKAYLAAHIRDFGMEIKCSILHNPAIDIGDIVTLENPLTLRDAIKSIDKGLPEYLFVKGMSISWTDGGPITNDLSLSYSPESPERDADTSTTTKTTTSDDTSGNTGSSGYTGSASQIGEGTIDGTEASADTDDKDAWHQNVWNQLYEVTKNYIDVTNRTQYTNRLYNAKTDWTTIYNIVIGHKLKGGVTRNYVINEIVQLKKGTITKTSMYHSKSSGKLQARKKTSSYMNKATSDRANQYIKSHNLK